MKFKIEYHAKGGDVRTVRKFLWFPKTLTLYGTLHTQTRWLEFASIQQSYSAYWSDWFDGSWSKEE